MIKTLSPTETRAAIDAGARLIDIRDVDEHARERIAGATSLPLARISDLSQESRPVIFHCRSGMRTATNAAHLAKAAGDAPAYILDGGLDAWRRAGLATVADRSQPMEIMRQVQITAGALVLTGVLLGLFVAPGYFALSAFVGAGLMFAGATGWFGMANLLRIMPWNRRTTA
ncbi:rhodanese-like domain-containing protein [Sphingobium boeckii]|uniref:Rhodanese-related sulfurtransferase n=1 Tax=Sphingobium boeckii TaxID=1082345 RepID=A0A7W9AK12_9SPHN|nr:rhodanese-like domain-containing protein [Sphingobium boeckii]MBB5687085.1 rhodanese-related sulfurtransferase [Sphingobium boeckii]